MSVCSYQTQKDKRNRKKQQSNHERDKILNASEQKEHRAEKQKEKKKQKKFRDWFFHDPKGKLLSYYDTYMLLVIAYSCFSSAYFCAFEFPTD